MNDEGPDSRKIYFLSVGQQCDMDGTFFRKKAYERDHVHRQGKLLAKLVAKRKTHSKWKRYSPFEREDARYLSGFP